MSIEDIAQQAIIDINNSTTEQLRQKCVELGHCPIDKELTANIGKKCIKDSSKPFKSGNKINTISGVVVHPILNIPAYTFEEDDSYVECRRVAVLETQRQINRVIGFETVMVKIEQMIRQSNFADLNQFLNDYDIEHCDNTYILVTIVRSPFRVRSLLPSWEQTVRRGAARIRQLGLNPDSLYVGLDRNLWN